MNDADELLAANLMSIADALMKTSRECTTLAFRISQAKHANGKHPHRRAPRPRKVQVPDRLSGRALAKWRKRLGLSVRDLAEKSGYGLSTIQAWEAQRKGRYPIPEEREARLIELLQRLDK